MPRRAAHPEHENHERWLVSYADFITLLFAFFVVMFASSQTDKARAKQVSESVKDALNKGGITAAVREVLGGTVDDKGKGNAMMKGPGGTISDTHPAVPPTLTELIPSAKYLGQALAAEIKDGKVQLRLEARGLVISLQQATFFPSGEDGIEPSTFGMIEKIAKVIAPLPNLVRLEGHTDSVPIHNSRFRSNWELAGARSVAMLNLLHERFGIPETRMAIAGYAETVPIASNDTEEGRSRNRRVDIVILGERAMADEPRSGTSRDVPLGLGK